MVKTTFRVSKMDCPSEEQMMRTNLEGMTGTQNLKFDIPECRLEIYHTDSYEGFFAALESLRLDAKLISSLTMESIHVEKDHYRQKRALMQVLATLLFLLLL
jgi:copper chaperone CopZ